MNKKNITKYLDNIDNYNFIATGHVDSIKILKFNFNNFFSFN